MGSVIRSFARTVVVAGTAWLVAGLSYVLLVVPQLDRVTVVPTGWWLAVALPFVAAAVVIGRGIAAPRELLAHAGVATCVTLACQYFAARAELPGTGKSWSSETPLAFWIIGGLAEFATWSIVLAIVFFARRSRQRTSSALGDPRGKLPAR